LFSKVFPGNLVKMSYPERKNIFSHYLSVCPSSPILLGRYKIGDYQIIVAVGAGEAKGVGVMS
jgi:hypothetical protein